MTDKPPYVLRAVGTIKTDYGVSSEVIFGPFTTADLAFEFCVAHRDEWNLVHAPQIMPLTTPTPNAPSERN